MHYYVFDKNNEKQLIELMFEEVVVDIVKNDEFSDNVVLFKNKLNSAFVKKIRPSSINIQKSFYRLIPSSEAFCRQCV